MAPPEVSQQFDTSVHAGGRKTSLIQIDRLWREVAIPGSICDHWNRDMAALFWQWRACPDTAPSLMDLIKKGAENFGADGFVNERTVKDWRLAMEVAKICDGEQNVPYHSHHHTREVLVMGTALAIRQKALSGLSFSEFLKVATGACLHDYGHPGGNNGAGDSHVPFLLECRSFDEVAEKIPDEMLSDLEPFSVMNSFTDFSKRDPADASQVSPAKLLRLAALAKTDEEILELQIKSGVPFDNVVPGFDLVSFLHSEWALPTLLLAEADISSSSLDKNFTYLMTRLISEEIPAIPDAPQSAVGFLKFACEEMFISAAANDLIEPGRVAVLNEIERDIAAGIVLAPANA